MDSGREGGRERGVMCILVYIQYCIQYATCIIIYLYAHY